MKKILLLTADLFDERELIYPYYRVQEAGFEAEVAATEAKAYKSKAGMSFKADKAFKDISADDYAGLIIPGGFAPDKIRTDEDAINLVKAFHEADKPIAMICHAGWVGISAGILKDKKATSVKAISDDMKNAGANWVDEEVVVDGNLITSRTPADLPVFMEAFLKSLDQD